MPEQTEIEQMSDAAQSAAAKARHFDATLSRMSQLVSQLDEAIRAGRGTDHLWEQLHECNVVLYTEAHGSAKSTTS